MCQYSLDGVNWHDAPNGQFTVQGRGTVHVRYYGKSVSAQGLAAQASDEQAVLSKQVSAWRAEVARLNDLIAHASGVQASDEPMRDAFELWALTEGWTTCEIAATRTAEGYTLTTLQQVWRVWQAAAGSAQPAGTLINEGTKATPRATADVEPIDGDMLVLKLREASVVNGRGASWLLNGDSMPFSLEGLLNVIRIAAIKPGETT